MTESIPPTEESIGTVDFDGNTYAVEDLTHGVIDKFNMLIKLQNEISEQSYQLKKSQAAQTSLSLALRENIEADKLENKATGQQGE